MPYPLVRLAPGLRPRRGHPLQQLHHAGPHRPRGRQMLAGQTKQQGRRVVFHRAGEQELVQLLQFQRLRRLPVQVPRHLAQMPGAALLPLAVEPQLAHGDLQVLGQPGHHRHRCRGDVVRDEPEPRQGAQLDRQPQPVLRATAAARIDEAHVCRRQREEPDQLFLVDLREAAQPRQLVIREHGSPPRNPHHKQSHTAAPDVSTAYRITW